MKKRITPDEVNRLYIEYETPPWVIAHCKAVAEVAAGLAKELNRHGYDLDTDLVLGASLAHDVARKEDRHDLVGADILAGLGYEDEAGIVRAHMTYPRFNKIDRLNECDLVCLADRVVKEDRYVGLDDRIEYILQKARDASPEQIEKILINKEKTKNLIKQIESITGKSMDMMFADAKMIKEKLDPVLKRVEKPGRYTGGEIYSAVKDEKEIRERFAFAFPDMYEIGMSYLGMQILYKAVNDMDGLYCERVFAPGEDMKKIMKTEGIPLFTLETKTPVKKTDMLGFTLQYEMSYTTVLDMLDLAGIPLLSSHRGEDDPVIAAGGPCAFNPEPLADFIDIFLIGDGE
ncbi:MAG: HD domain-containing protein, partial [Anaerovoracaceae bacterium]|nr:HD domain-containing protein [Anaerovoracaceae bacterium]